MTEDGISRRQVLRAASVAGGLGVASGVATQTLLGDREAFGNAVGAGTLDLLVAADAPVDPTSWPPEQVPLDSGSGVSVSLNEECGTAGLAFTVCGNPGTVELFASAEEWDENDDDHDHHEDFEKEWKHWTEKFSRNFEKKGEGVVTHRYYGGPPQFVRDWKKDPFVTLYTGDCEDGRVIAAGELSTVLSDVSGGVPLHPNCSRLKIEEADIEDGDVELDGGNVTVTLETDTNDEGETVGVDIVAVDGASLCQVNVKGGGKPFPEPCEIPGWASYPWECSGKSFWKWWFSNVQMRSGREDSDDSGWHVDTTGGDHSGTGGDHSGTGGDHFGSGGNGWWKSYGKRVGVKPYYFDCESSAEGLETRDDGATEVSHIELFTCEERCFDCARDEPFPLFLQWEGLEEETPIDVTLEARQCRHSDGETNDDQ